jgi:hypothetical protein
MRGKHLFCLAVLGLVLLGCGNDTNGSERAIVGVPLPTGDHERGREAFRSQGCTLCHRATGELDLPAPVSVNTAPEIGIAQVTWSASDLTRAIVDPSHRFEPDSPDAGAQGSPMLDYIDELTLRELADLLAYIRYLGE